MKKNYLSVKELQQILKNPDYLAVDIRENEVYSGWTISASEKGGHIPGVWDKFTLYDDISKNKKIILCGNNVEDMEKLTEELYILGYDRVYKFKISEWLACMPHEWEKYPNYSLYIPAEIVKRILEGEFPEEIKPTENLLIFDIGWGDERKSGYLQGHIPGAIHINSDEFEPPRVYVSNKIEWRIAKDNELIKLAKRYGITVNSTIVIYGEELSAACRFAVICKYLGVEKVYVMSRGLRGWSEKKYSLTREKSSIVSTDVFGYDEPKNKKLIDSLEQLYEKMLDPNYILVDVRGWDEYIGKSSGYDYHDIAGRIPGSKFGGIKGQISEPMSVYRNKDLTMKNPKKILRMWTECGIDVNKHLSFLCGSGWRASEVLWDALVMGLKDVSIFSDGWIAWSNERETY